MHGNEVKKATTLCCKHWRGAYASGILIPETLWKFSMWSSESQPWTTWTNLKSVKWVKCLTKNSYLGSKYRHDIADAGESSTLSYKYGLDVVCEKELGWHTSFGRPYPAPWDLIQSLGMPVMYRTASWFPLVCKEQSSIGQPGCVGRVQVLDMDQELI